STSLPAQKESPAPCQSTTRVCSSLAAPLKTSARVTYMLEVIAFFLVGRFNSTRRTLPERSVTISFIGFFLYPPMKSELGLDRALAKRCRPPGCDRGPRRPDTLFAIRRDHTARRSLLRSALSPCRGSVRGPFFRFWSANTSGSADSAQPRS